MTEEIKVNPRCKPSLAAGALVGSPGAAVAVGYGSADLSQMALALLTGLTARLGNW